MQEEIFRKKSLDKIKSPETLDDYIHVSNPGVWLVLVGIITLLLGACAWGIFGHIDSTVPSTVCVENGKTVCYIAEQDIASVRTGLTVRYANCEAVISKIGEKGDMGYTCEMTTTASVADGFYKGKVVLKRYKPLSFVLN